MTGNGSGAELLTGFAITSHFVSVHNTFENVSMLPFFGVSPPTSDRLSGQPTRVNVRAIITLRKLSFLFALADS
jgi:hypothetical protein